MRLKWDNKLSSMGFKGNDEFPLFPLFPLIGLYIIKPSFFTNHMDCKAFIEINKNSNLKYRFTKID